MPLVCQDCHASNGKQIIFFQISRKFKNLPFSREIRQSTNGIHLNDWVEFSKESLDDGIYCSECHSIVNDIFFSQEERTIFKDSRMETLSFKETPINEFVESIKRLSERNGASIEQYTLPSIPAEFGELEYPLPNEITKKLQQKGIEKLYSHQAEAINKIRSGKNVVITTGTASGKSLVYTIPALESFVTNEDATALYLSPLKALTRDQLVSLEMFDDSPSTENTTFGYTKLQIGCKKIGVGVLEGGKNDAVKELTYQNARYWLTNVHYLHFILQGAAHFKKNNQAFVRFFKNLKYVILDELHAYNGVLGSKVAMLLRRLRSLCKAFGANPQFITCSASIGNPKELAEEITGLKGVKGFTMINNDGSPKHQREILLLNPGYLEQKSESRTRRAPISEVIDIFKYICINFKKFPKTIVFYGNRKATETASFELNNAIRSRLSEVSKGEEISQEFFTPFHAYLNSYKKQEVMGRIKKGELVGIVSTSALEMGIDIGDLDLCIMVGYAGSKASFLQQAGRVGRKGPGIVIQLFQENPLEQYYAINPKEFMEREAEHVSIDVGNPNIVAEHMQYAAHELNGKITSAHSYFKVSAARKSDNFTNKIIESGKGTWKLNESEIKYNNLLSSSKLYDVISQQGLSREIILEGIDDRTMLRDYHFGAVFLYNQKSYKVIRILPSKNEIIVAQVKADYTTRGLINDSIYIIDQTKEINLTDVIGLVIGKLEITRRLWGYKKINLFGGGVSDLIEENNMYPVKYETDGLWIQFKQTNISDGALHVAEHAIASAIPTVVKCSQNDFSFLSSTNLKEFNYFPTIVFYETGGGGAGIMETISDRLINILNKAVAILKSCQCKQGCPNCTHLSTCERNNEVLDKSGGIELIKSIKIKTEKALNVSNI